MTRALRSPRSILLVIAVALAPRLAPAQLRDPAAAAELFRQGRAELAAKDFAAACRTFAESARLDPRVGTWINLALCYEETSRLASALGAWQAAADQAHATGEAREAYASEHAAAVDARAPHLEIVDGPGAGPEVSVVLDGVAIAPADRGRPIAIDPGGHVLVVRALGHDDNRIEVAPGQTTVFAVPGPAMPPPVAPAPAPVAAPSRALQRGIAYVLAGLGVAGVAVGAVYGAQAIQAKNDPRCSAGVCTPDGALAQRNGIDAGNRATVAFIAGGALIGGAAVVWLTSPRRAVGPSIAIAPVPGGASLTLGGAW